MRKKLRYVVLASKTIVIDEHDKVVVSCPTEEEAVEFIREYDSEEDEADDKKGIS